MRSENFVNRPHSASRKRQGWFSSPEPSCKVCGGFDHLSEFPEIKVVCTVCQLGRELPVGADVELQRTIDITIAHLTHIGHGRQVRSSGVVLKAAAVV